MNKIIKTLIVPCLFVFGANDIKAQSALVTFSPSSSTLIGDASRIGYHYNNKSSYYMQYNDASYICCALNPALIIPSPTSMKITMPQDFVISDFKKFRLFQGYIGSYEGIGMFGFIWNVDLLDPNLYTYTFKLPAINQLNRIAVEPSSTKTKAFAIGEKLISGGIYQSCLLEFYAEGVSINAPYTYAPLVCNQLLGQQEFADDVIILEKKVVFATRYLSLGQQTINLRISDTANALGSSSIKIRWQLVEPFYEVLSSKLRMIVLDDSNFILAYTIYNEKDDKYYLCIHRVSLPDFLSGINSIVSHAIEINKDCSVLTDIIYEPDVQTMVVLFNGDGSEFYHVDPYSNINDISYKLDYANGNFYSIDTIGNYTGMNEDGYFAIGQNEIFWQDISNGIEIENSCLPIVQPKFMLREPPRIKKIQDKIILQEDNRVLNYFTGNSIFFLGLRTCSVLLPE